LVFSTDDLLAEVTRRKLFVTSLYEGRDGLWRTYLRKKKADAAPIARGEGKTAAQALQRALAANEIDDLIG
jgi:hypothetical protein